MYLAIDQATTSGIAYFHNSKIIVTEFVGTPIELFDYCFGICNLMNFKSILLEKMVYMRNTIPMTSLVERTGYLFYKFQEKQFEIEKVHSGSARKLLGFSKELNNKKKVLSYFQEHYNRNFTDNCSDAVVLLLSKYPELWKTFEIELRVNPKEKKKKDATSRRS